MMDHILYCVFNICLTNRHEHRSIFDPTELGTRITKNHKNQESEEPGKTA